MQTNFIELARKEGFADAAVIETKKIVLDASFRPYCEENLCGMYGANYSCPPDCGTPAEMEQRLLGFQRALVLRSVWSINDFKDTARIKAAKKEHNEATLRIAEELRRQGHQGLMIGASCCSLCSTCEKVQGNPCKFPQKQFSCMSAYCIYVKDLAEKCGMIYDYQKDALPLFSMYAFD